jgi:hypothetical protein
VAVLTWCFAVLQATFPSSDGVVEFVDECCKDSVALNATLMETKENFSRGKDAFLQQRANLQFAQLLAGTVDVTDLSGRFLASNQQLATLKQHMTELDSKCEASVSSIAARAEKLESGTSTSVAVVTEF